MDCMQGPENNKGGPKPAFAVINHAASFRTYPTTAW